MARRTWTGQVGRLAALGSAVLVLAAVFIAVGPPAGAASTGYVRLAHLSPGTPKVDVYLTSFRGGSFSKVLKGVGYGAVSPYERAAPGSYTVSMRLAGAAPDSPPVLSTNVTVLPRRAYTVAGVGPKTALKLRVLHDRLAQPAPRKAAVRVVQASLQAPDIDLATSTGMEIAMSARFPSTTRYLEVPAQRWLLQVRRHGSDKVVARRAIALSGGAIQTVLVLDGSDGVQLRVTADAAGSAVMPAGGVAAGLGGTADQGPADQSPADRGPTGRSTMTLVAALLALATGLAMTTRWLARR